MMEKKTTKRHWDSLWEKSNLLYNEKICSIIKEKFDIKGLKILEVGAGSGNTSIYLASLGADVTALDYSNKSIKLIEKNNINNYPIKIIQGDAFHLPFYDNTFDLVFSQGLIEHFRNPEEIVKEKRRVTKKGGYVLVDVPQKYNMYTLKKVVLISLNKWFAGWERSFSINELTSLVENCGLKVEEKFAYSHIHNLHRIQMRILKKEIIPKFITNFYNKSWEIFEKSFISPYILFAIIVLAKK